MTQPPTSFQTTAYLALSKISLPLWHIALKRRVKSGKEDPTRVFEKLGLATQKRPKGRLIWCHALSVGESLALLTLIRKILDTSPDITVLLTTTTRTSVEALAKAGLPDRVIHQFAPVDAQKAVDRFLNHWHPDVAVFAELDLWPCLLARTTKRNIPALLINTRLSQKRFTKRQKLRTLYRDVLHQFNVLLLQDTPSQDRFLAMGAPKDRIQVLGALKSAGAPLKDSPKARAKFDTAMGDRPIWLAAATDQREEQSLLKAHAIVQETLPNALMIIAPRHIKACDGLDKTALETFQNVSRRSADEPVSPQTDVYIADTIGEMGLWHRISPISFIGFSLPVEGPPLTGKNPFEALVLNSLVIHGPHFGNFEDSYDRLLDAGASVLIQDPQTLAAAVISAQDNQWRAPYLDAAKQVALDSQNTLSETYRQIMDRLPPPSE